MPLEVRALPALLVQCEVGVPQPSHGLLGLDGDTASSGIHPVALQGCTGLRTSAVIANSVSVLACRDDPNRFHFPLAFHCAQ